MPRPAGCLHRPDANEHKGKNTPTRVQRYIHPRQDECRTEQVGLNTEHLLHTWRLLLVIPSPYGGECYHSCGA